MKPPSWKEFLIWWCDAACKFTDGFIQGAWVGTGAGGANAAASDTTNVETLTWRALIAFVVTCALNGLKEVVVWNRNNPIPNPFRATPQVPVIPNP
jgi:hypothetical protein